MLIPGNSFADYLFIAITFVSLLPALLVLFQKSFAKEPIQLLFIICLITFVRELPGHARLLYTDQQTVIDNICFPLELILVARLFTPYADQPLRNRLQLFQVAFVSALLAWLSAKGWTSKNLYLELIQHGTLIAIILSCLPALIRAKGLYIFRSSVFWIAAGTLFHLSILLILEWVGHCCGLDSEQKVFLSIASLIRFALYTFAILPGRDEASATP